MLRPRTRVSLAILAGLAVFVGTPERAVADFYRCYQNGRELVTNSPLGGKGTRCRLIMRTGSGGSGASPSVGPPRSSSPRARPGGGGVTEIEPGPRGGGSDLPSESLLKLAREAADRYTLPLAFVLAVMKVESNFYPRAVSRVGAQGLMQLMPGTADSLGVSEAFDPRQNVFGGCKYLRMLANRFNGDLVRTLAGYHAGGAAVAEKEGVPYAQTEVYVRMVLDRYYGYKALLAD